MDAFSSPARRTLIRKALSVISDGQYQALGVWFVCISRNGEGIEWMAVDKDGNPGRGHPDGRVRLGGTRFLDVEVSKAERWSLKITREDLPAIARAAKPTDPKPEGLVFVTSAYKDLSKKKNEQAVKKAEARIREKAQKLLGVAPDQLTFIHQNELVEYLATPPFAQLARQWLNIPLNPKPFRTVADAIAISEGARRGEMPWIPSLEEYRAGAIRVPDRDWSAAKQILERSKELTLLGRGATGKTVLAFLLGLDAEQNGCNALYVDLMRQGELTSQDLVDGLAQYADDRSLVIFDNTHLYDRTAMNELKQEITVRQERRELPSFRVVYVGKDMRAARGLRTGGRAATAPRSAAASEVVLNVDRFVLECAFSRFEHQFTEQTRRKLPPAARELWCSNPQAFGCDLVLFSIAVLSNLNHLDDATFDLEAVYKHVGEKYLEPYPRKVVVAFLDLCALAQFDVELSDKALGARNTALLETAQMRVRSFVERGVVLKRKIERFGLRYSVVHSSFARVVLNAAADPECSIEKLVKSAGERDPHLIAPLLRSVEHDEAHKDLFESVRRWIVRKRQRLACVLFRTPAQFWPWLVSLLPPGPKGVHAWRAALSIATNRKNRAARVEWIRNTPLHFLATWCKHLDALPNAPHDLVMRARASVLADLAANEHTLSQHVLDTPLHFLAAFLRYLDGIPNDEGQARVVADRVRSELATSSLYGLVSVANCEQIATLLRYLDERTDENSRVAATAIRELLARHDLSGLLKRTPLDALADFLRYLDQRPASEAPSESIAHRVRMTLATSDLLSLKIVEASSTALVGFLKEIDDLSRSQPGDSPVEALLEKTRVTLRTGRIQENLSRRITVEKSAGRLGSLPLAVRAVDPHAWEEVVRRLQASLGADGLAARLKSPCSLRDATTFLGALEGCDENALLKGILDILLRNPEDLAERASKEKPEASAHLLFRARHGERESVCRFLAALKNKMPLTDFYGPDGPGPAAMFLWNAWQILGPSSEFDSLWDEKLVKMVNACLCRWQDDTHPLLLLGRTLQLLGMITRFPSSVHACNYDARRLRGIIVPDRSTCDSVLGDPRFDHFSDVTRMAAGMEALGCSVGAVRAAAVIDTLTSARSQAKNPVRHIDEMVCQAEAWLKSQGQINP